MRKKRAGDEVLVPNDAVILGIDPGKKAGAAVLYKSHLLVSMQVKDAPAARANAIKVAFDCSHTLMRELEAEGIKEKIPVVLVMERFTPGAGKHFSARTRDGIAQRAGAWLEAWKIGGGSTKHIVRVYPAAWRSPVLGRGGGSTELLKSLARLYASQRYGVEAADDNEAEAICIGTWGVTAVEVGIALGSRT